MKKLFFFATLIAATAFGLTSCSDSNGGDSPSGGDGEGQTAYLAVRLTGVGNVPGMGSKPFLREANDATVANPNEPGTGKYVDGNPATEGAIKAVRFYFFNADGTPYKVQGDQSYIDPTDVSRLDDSAEDAKTIESKTNVVLVINGKNNSQTLPSRMAVVLNKGTLSPTELPEENLSESSLAAITRTIAQNNNSEKGFVMSNSIYLDESSKSPLISTPIDATKFKPTAEQAQGGTLNGVTYDADPVEIYVERVAAGVQVAQQSSLDAWTTTTTLDNTIAEADAKPAYQLTTGATVSYKTATTTGEYTTGTTPQLYVVVQGWGLADENGNAPLFKQLESSYESLGTATNNPLSVAAYHRSFWETANGFNAIRYNYNQYTHSLGEGRIYTMPNTPTKTTSGNNIGWANWSWSSDELNRRTVVAPKSTTEPSELQSPTKVVVAAKLMYVDPTTNKLTEAEICNYRGQNYLTEGNLKIAIANDVAHSTAYNVYKKVGENYVTVDAGDFTDFKVSGIAGTKESYRVTPQLKTLATGENYYQKTGDADPAIITYDKANENVANVAGSDITIYRHGMTYYYTTLQHLWYDTSKTDSEKQPMGAWGVVRNHLYSVTLTGFTGLGTPVYDPAQAIIPIVPQDDKVYLAARINVLQWRLVEQTANMNGQPITQ